MTTKPNKLADEIAACLRAYRGYGSKIGERRTELLRRAEAYIRSSPASVPSEAEEDDTFARQYHAALSTMDADSYARILSGRLRQMDKRCRAANKRADALEAKLAALVPTKEQVAEAGKRALARLSPTVVDDSEGAPVGSRPFAIGNRVRKRKGSSWQGRVVGFYATDLTPAGICVESEREAGSVQIYPATALEAVAPAGADEEDDLDPAVIARIQAMADKEFAGEEFVTISGPSWDVFEDLGVPKPDPVAADGIERELRYLQAVAGSCESTAFDLVVGDDFRASVRSLGTLIERQQADLARAKAEGRRAGIEEAAKQVDEWADTVVSSIRKDAFCVAAKSIRSLAGGES